MKSHSIRFIGVVFLLFSNSLFAQDTYSKLLTFPNGYSLSSSINLYEDSIIVLTGKNGPGIFMSNVDLNASELHTELLLVNGWDLHIANSEASKMIDGSMVFGGTMQQEFEESDAFFAFASSTQESILFYPIPDSAYQQVSALLNLTDSTCLLIGSSFKGDPDGDILVVKIGINGEVISTMEFGTMVREEAYCAIKTSDGGIVIVAEQNKYLSSIYVVKLDSNLDIQWEKTFQGDYKDHPESVEIMDDGKILIGGFYGDSLIGAPETGVYFERPWLICLNEDGELAWEKKYNYSTFNSGIAATLQLDDELIVAAYQANGHDGITSTILMSTDLEGKPNWERSIAMGEDTASISGINDLVPDGFGGFYGYGHFLSLDTANLWIIHADSNGCVDSTWQHCIVGLDEVRKDDESDAVVFPNPTMDSFNLPDSEIKELKLYDVSGNVVFNKLDPQNVINVSFLNAGLYFGEYANFNDEVKRFRLIKL